MIKKVIKIKIIWILIIDIKLYIALCEDCYIINKNIRFQKEFKMKEKITLIKNNKFNSFLALGGVATMGLMELGWIDDDLTAPRVMLAIGALGIAKLLYANKKKSLEFGKGAFLTVGSVAALLAFEHYKLPLQGVGQLVFDTTAAYGALSVLSEFNTAVKDTANFTLNSIGKIKEKIGIVRSHATPNEFNFDFTQKNKR